jgi:hypothetical protein
LDPISVLIGDTALLEPTMRSTDVPNIQFTNNPTMRSSTRILFKSVFTINDTTLADISGNMIIPKKIGTTTIKAVQTPDNKNYEPSTIIITITVKKSITLSNFPDIFIRSNVNTYTIIPPTTSIDVSGVFEYRINNDDSVADISDGIITVKKRGVITDIRALFVPASSYYSQSAINTRLLIQQTVTFKMDTIIIKNGTTDNPIPSPRMSTNINGTYTYTIEDTSMVDLSGNKLIGKNRGITRIRVLFTPDETIYAVIPDIIFADVIVQDDILISDFSIPDIYYDTSYDNMYTIPDFNTIPPDISGSYVYDIDDDRIATIVEKNKIKTLNRSTTFITATFIANDISYYSISSRQLLTIVSPIQEIVTLSNFNLPDILYYGKRYTINPPTLSTKIRGYFIYSINDVVINSNYMVNIPPSPIPITIKATFDSTTAGYVGSDISSNEIIVEKYTPIIRFEPFTVRYLESIQLPLSTDVSGDFDISFVSNGETEYLSIDNSFNVHGLQPGGPTTIVAQFTPTNLDFYTIPTDASRNVDVLQGTLLLSDFDIPILFVDNPTRIYAPIIKNINNDIIDPSDCDVSFSIPDQYSSYATVSETNRTSSQDNPRILYTILNPHLGGFVEITCLVTPHDIRYEPTSITTRFVITKLTPDFYDFFMPTNILFGNTYTINSNDISYNRTLGEVTYSMDSSYATVTSAGDVTPMDLGENITILATLTPNNDNSGKYVSNTTVSSPFNIITNQPTLECSVPDIELYSQFTIQPIVNPNISGSYNYSDVTGDISINGETLTITAGNTVGPSSFVLIFTPTDSRYNSVTKLITFNVTKIIPILKFKIPKLAFGSDYVLKPRCTNTTGTFSYTTSSPIIKDIYIENGVLYSNKIGTYTVTATFLPDSSDYVFNSISAIVEINQKPIIITEFDIPDIICLSSESFTEPTTEPYQRGSFDYFVDYGDISFSVSDQITVTANIPAPVILPEGAAYTNVIGTGVLVARFTPFNVNFQTITNYASFNILKIPTSLSNFSFGNKFFGTDKSDLFITDPTNLQRVRGSYSYDIINGSQFATIEQEGNIYYFSFIKCGEVTVQATFIPDLHYYARSTITTTFTILPRIITFGTFTIPNIPYKKSITLTNPTRSPFVDGSFNYVINGAENTIVGNSIQGNVIGQDSVTFTFTPKDKNFATYTSLFTTFDVIQSDPTVVIPLFIIPYNGSTIINYTSDVSGTFTVIPDDNINVSGNTLTAIAEIAKYDASYTFVPDDSGYKNVSNTFQYNIVPIETVIDPNYELPLIRYNSRNTLNPIAYIKNTDTVIIGNWIYVSNPNFYANVGIDGIVTTTNLTTNQVGGPELLRVDFIPLDKNYGQSHRNFSFNVVQAIPSFTNFTIPNIIYESVRDFPYPATMDGSYNYAIIEGFDNGTIINNTIYGNTIGNGTVRFTFTPYNTMYETASIDSSFTVVSIPTSLSNFNIPDVSYGDPDFEIIDPSVDIDGEFNYTIDGSNNATIVNEKFIHIEHAGLVTVLATFTPYNSNYASSTISSTFRIFKQTPILSNFNISNVTYGDEDIVITDPTVFPEINIINVGGGSSIGNSSNFYIPFVYEIIDGSNDAIMSSLNTIKLLNPNDNIVVKATFNPYNIDFNETSITTSFSINKIPTAFNFTVNDISYGTVNRIDSPVLTTLDISGEYTYSIVDGINDATITSDGFITPINIASITVNALFTPTNKKYATYTKNSNSFMITKSKPIIFNFLIGPSIESTTPTEIKTPFTSVQGICSYSILEGSSYADISNTYVIPKAIGPVKVECLFTPTNSRYETITATTSFNIVEGNYTISNFNISDVSYGDPDFEIIEPSVDIDGSYNYTILDSSNAEIINDTYIRIKNAGLVTVEYTFTPLDDLLYLPKKVTTSFFIHQLPSTITQFNIPDVSMYTTSQIVDVVTDISGSIIFSNIGSISATVSSNGIITPLTPGRNMIEATLTPTNPNYAISTRIATFYVVKATPTITNFVIEDITYLSNPQQINRPTVDVSGTFSYSITEGSSFAYITNDNLINTLSVGPCTVRAIFTPFDSNYEITTITTTFDVLQKTPTLVIRLPDAPFNIGDIVTLNADVTPFISGDYVWSSNATPLSDTIIALDQAGDVVIELTFTPSNSNYTNSVISTTIHVNQIDVSFSISIPDIPYDSSYVIPDSIVTPFTLGEFSYSFDTTIDPDSNYSTLDISGKKINVGTIYSPGYKIVYATFTPYDINYKPYTVTTSFSLIKKRINYSDSILSTITIPDLSYNTPYTIPFPILVEGNFNIVNTSDNITNFKNTINSNSTGDSYIIFTFVPYNTFIYSFFNITSNFQVLKIQPTFSISIPDDIEYNRSYPITKSSLNPDISGSYVYASLSNNVTVDSLNARITGKNIGVATVRSTFTPISSLSTNYDSYTTTFEVNVVKLQPTFSIDIPDIQYDSSYAIITPTINPDISGQYTYVSDSSNAVIDSSNVITGKHIGPVTITATFIPEDTTICENATESSTFSVVTLSPILSNYTFNDVTFGDPDITIINPTANIEGIFSLPVLSENATIVSGKIHPLSSGIINIQTTFIPTNPIYKNISISTTLNVLKIPTTISNFAISNDNNGNTFIITPPSGNVPGEISYTTDESFASVTDNILHVDYIEKVKVTALFTPDDTNYNTSTTTTTFNPLPATISKLYLKNVYYGKEDYQVDSPETSVDGQIIYSIVDGSDYASITSSGLIHIENAGQVTVQAKLIPFNTTYISSITTASFTVYKKITNIGLMTTSDFMINDVYYDNPDFQINPPSCLPGTLTYRIDNNSNATITPSGMIHILNIGRVTVIATLIATDTSYPITIYTTSFNILPTSANTIFKLDRTTYPAIINAPLYQTVAGDFSYSIVEGSEYAFISNNRIETTQPDRNVIVKATLTPHDDNYAPSYIFTSFYTSKIPTTLTDFIIPTLDVSSTEIISPPTANVPGEFSYHITTYSNNQFVRTISYSAIITNNSIRTLQIQNSPIFVTATFTPTDSIYASSTITTSFSVVNNGITPNVLFRLNDENTSSFLINDVRISENFFIIPSMVSNIDGVTNYYIVRGGEYATIPDNKITLIKLKQIGEVTVEAVFTPTNNQYKIYTATASFRILPDIDLTVAIQDVPYGTTPVQLPLSGSYSIVDGSSIASVTSSGLLTTLDLGRVTVQIDSTLYSFYIVQGIPTSLSNFIVSNVQLGTPDYYITPPYSSINGYFTYFIVDGSEHATITKNGILHLLTTGEVTVQAVLNPIKPYSISKITTTFNIIVGMPYVLSNFIIPDININSRITITDPTVTPYTPGKFEYSIYDLEHIVDISGKTITSLSVYGDDVPVTALFTPDNTEYYPVSSITTTFHIYKENTIFNKFYKFNVVEYNEPFLLNSTNNLFIPITTNSNGIIRYYIDTSYLQYCYIYQNTIYGLELYNDIPITAIISNTNEYRIASASTTFSITRAKIKIYNFIIPDLIINQSFNFVDPPTNIKVDSRYSTTFEYEVDSPNITIVSDNGVNTITGSVIERGVKIKCIVITTNPNYLNINTSTIYVNVIFNSLTINTRPLPTLYLGNSIDMQNYTYIYPDASGSFSFVPSNSIAEKSGTSIFTFNSAGSVNITITFTPESSSSSSIPITLPITILKYPVTFTNSIILLPPTLYVNDSIDLLNYVNKAYFNSNIIPGIYAFSNMSSGPSNISLSGSILTCESNGPVQLLCTFIPNDSFTYSSVTIPTIVFYVHIRITLSNFEFKDTIVNQTFRIDPPTIDPIIPGVFSYTSSSSITTLTTDNELVTYCSCNVSNSLATIVATFTPTDLNTFNTTSIGYSFYIFGEPNLLFRVEDQYINTTFTLSPPGLYTNGDYNSYGLPGIYTYELNSYDYADICGNVITTNSAGNVSVTSTFTPENTLLSPLFLDTSFNISNYSLESITLPELHVGDIIVLNHPQTNPPMTGTVNYSIDSSIADISVNQLTAISTGNANLLITFTPTNYPLNVLSITIEIVIFSAEITLSDFSVLTTYPYTITPPTVSPEISGGLSYTTNIKALSVLNNYIQYVDYNGPQSVTATFAPSDVSYNITSVVYLMTVPDIIPVFSPFTIPTMYKNDTYLLTTQYYTGTNFTPNIGLPLPYVRELTNNEFTRIVDGMYTITINSDFAQFISSNLYDMCNNIVSYGTLRAIKGGGEVSINVHFEPNSNVYESITQTYTFYVYESVLTLTTYQTIPNLFVEGTGENYKIRPISIFPYVDGEVDIDISSASAEFHSNIIKDPITKELLSYGYIEVKNAIGDYKVGNSNCVDIKYTFRPTEFTLYPVTTITRRFEVYEKYTISPLVIRPELNIGDSYTIVDPVTDPSNIGIFVYSILDVLQPITTVSDSSDFSKIQLTVQPVTETDSYNILLSEILLYNSNITLTDIHVNQIITINQLPSLNIGSITNLIIIQIQQYVPNTNASIEDNVFIAQNIGPVIVSCTFTPNDFIYGYPTTITSQCYIYKEDTTLDNFTIPILTYGETYNIPATTNSDYVGYIYDGMDLTTVVSTVSIYYIIESSFNMYVILNQDGKSITAVKYTDMLIPITAYIPSTTMYRSRTETINCQVQKITPTISNFSIEKITYNNTFIIPPPVVTISGIPLPSSIVYNYVYILYNTNSDVLTISDNIITPTQWQDGLFNITATIIPLDPELDNYVIPESIVSNSFIIEKSTYSIEPWIIPGPFVFGTDVVLTYPITNPTDVSGSFSFSIESGNATVSDNIVHFEEYGPVTITATFTPTDENYVSDALSTSYDITVSKRNSTLEWDFTIPPVVYDISYTLQTLATTNSDSTIVYSIDTPYAIYAYVNDTTIYCIKVTDLLIPITASVKETNKNFENSITKTFTLLPKPSVLDSFTLPDITYNSTYTILDPSHVPIEGRVFYTADVSNVSIDENNVISIDYWDSSSANIIAVFVPFDLNNYTISNTETAILTIHKLLSHVSIVTPTLTYGSPYQTIVSKDVSGSILYTLDQSYSYISINSEGLITILEAGGPISLTVTLIPDDNGYSQSSATTTFSVLQSTPSIGTFNVSDMIYGDTQTIADPSYSTVDGLFNYTVDTSNVTITNNIITINQWQNNPVSVSVILIPTDTANYTNSQPVTKLFSITKATPILTWDFNETIPYGDDYPIITPPDTNSDDIHFVYSIDSSYADVSGSVIRILQYYDGSIPITANLLESNNYYGGSVDSSFTIVKSNFTLGSFTLDRMTFGTTQTIIDPSHSSVDGSFNYTVDSSNVTISAQNVISIINYQAGPVTVTANFTPSDTINYETPTAVTATFSIAKAIPTLTWDFDEIISYGYDYSIINPPSTNSDDIHIVYSIDSSYADVSGSVISILQYNTSSIQIIAVLLESNNYYSRDVYGTFSILKAITTIGSFTLGPMTFGTTQTIIDPSHSSVDGSFNYTVDSSNVTISAQNVISILNYQPEQVTVFATFTPNNSNYTIPESVSATFRISKADPLLTWSFNEIIPHDTFHIIDKKPVSDSSGKITYVIDSSYAYTYGNIIYISDYFDGLITITANLESTNNYNEGSVDSTFTISQATSIISSFTLNNMTFGTPQQINALYYPSAGDILYTSDSSNVTIDENDVITVINYQPEQVTITGTFTPDDTVKYTIPESKTATFFILKANPILEPLTLNNMVYGTKQTIIDPSSSTIGSFVYSANTPNVEVSGNVISSKKWQRQEVTITGIFTHNDINYINDYSITANFNIFKNIMKAYKMEYDLATLELRDLNDSTINIAGNYVSLTYGDPLNESQDSSGTINSINQTGIKLTDYTNGVTATSTSLTKTSLTTDVPSFDLSCNELKLQGNSPTDNYVITAVNGKPTWKTPYNIPEVFVIDLLETTPYQIANTISSNYFLWIKGSNERSTILLPISQMSVGQMITIRSEDSDGIIINSGSNNSIYSDIESNVFETDKASCVKLFLAKNNQQYEWLVIN